MIQDQLCRARFAANLGRLGWRGVAVVAARGLMNQQVDARGQLNNGLTGFGIPRIGN